jgi:hypothetical protein
MMMMMSRRSGRYSFQFVKSKPKRGTDRAVDGESRCVYGFYVVILYQGKQWQEKEKGSSN